MVTEPRSVRRVQCSVTGYIVSNQVLIQKA